MLKQEFKDLKENLDLRFDQVNRGLEEFSKWAKDHDKAHFDDPKYMSFDVWLSSYKWKIFGVLLGAGLVIGLGVALGGDAATLLLKVLF